MPDFSNKFHLSTNGNGPVRQSWVNHNVHNYFILFTITVENMVNAKYKTVDDIAAVSSIECVFDVRTHLLQYNITFIKMLDEIKLGHKDRVIGNKHE